MSDESAVQQVLHLSRRLFGGRSPSPTRHEYRRGQVYARVGAKKSHVILASNLTTLLNVHLQDSPCLVMSSDMKVRLESANCYYYPDVVVTCDERDLSTTEDFIRFPTLVIEILSDSTAAFDRGDQFADYQTVPTLREYVLVNQSEMALECYRLTAEGWVGQRYGVGDTVRFESVGLECAIATLYQKVPGIAAG
nr:Uma2 family endonuclease [Thermoleptolyngbya sp. C42_A2020_037]